MDRERVVRLLQRLERVGFTKDNVTMDVGHHHMIVGLLCTHFKDWKDGFTRAELHDFFVCNIYAYEKAKERLLLEALERCLLCSDDPWVVEQRRLEEEERAKDLKRRKREELEAEILACEHQMQALQERLERLKRRIH